MAGFAFPQGQGDVRPGLRPIDHGMSVVVSVASNYQGALGGMFGHVEIEMDRQVVELADGSTVVMCEFGPDRHPAGRRAQPVHPMGQREDEVESVVKSLGLPYVLRTKFVGRDGREASCGLAIPTDGAGALIVCAVKANNSTGSKLSDTYREVKEMADARYGRLFVYVVVDGIGWLNGQSDLRKIVTSGRALD